ncbi:uncharacterized protein At3g17950-like [Neltuma alba]|uniref:uncharacterized protein At3g17950-like n=1 Tax=Neltuma alba TaxID=207710 RepID=UPI0010A4AC7E|nr:uncharacterized protein At3g17950-like [Prosopis alba]
MAQQDEGWPFGLQPLNARIGLAGNRDNSGSVSFNTAVTGSPSLSSSTDSSSDLDTESTGSFFPDKSRTLGSLIGVSSILELSRRSLRGVKTQVLKRKTGEKSNWRSWLGCSCWRTSHDAGNEGKEKNVASLGHFLAEERKAAIENRRNQSIPIYGPDDEFVLAQTQNTGHSNSLFVNGNVAPPNWVHPKRERKRGGSTQINGFGSLAALFSFACVRAQSAPA